MDRASERWCDASLRGIDRFAVLAPTAGWGAKQWPVERYGAVAKALLELGMIPLVNATRDGDVVAEAVRVASDGAARPLVCTVAQLLALMRRAAVVIAGDTGPLHLAAALGSSVVGLYGPTDPERTGPYGARGEVIRHKASHVDHRRHAEPEFGLSQITVEEVVAAAERASV